MEFRIIFELVVLDHCQRGLASRQSENVNFPDPVIRILLLLLLPLGISALHAREYGPICEWHEDPTTTMSIHWVAASSDERPGGEWKLGAAGFGYGDDDDQTVLKAMRGKYRSVYIRRAYEVPAKAPRGAELTVGIRYDDAFILYRDGKEVLRKGVEGAGASISKVKKHEAEVWEYFKIGPANPGQKGVIAIEGHNENIDSSDFTLRPRIDYRANGKLYPVIREGASWAYLAGGVPGAGWASIGGIGGDEAAATRYKFSYRTKGEREWSSAPIRERKFGKTEDLAFSADLRDLKPAGRYEFQIVRWGRPVGPWEFETAPARFQDGMTFVTGGDMYGTRAWLDAMNLRAGKEDPLFALLGGDLAYANGSNGGRWRDWLDSWNNCAVAPDGRLIPMVVAIGNHEVKGYQYRPKNAPGREEAPFFYSLFSGKSEGANFTVDFGDYLSLVGVDSGHTANIAAQTQWLGRVLGNRLGIPRQFVCYHRPAWGTGVKGDATDIRREWSPLFEQFKVDCVFENDHHTYKRTHPIVGGERSDKDGILYMGDGSWGVKTRNIPKDWKKRTYLAEAQALRHLIKVTLKKDEFLYEGMTEDGKIFDKTTRPLRRGGADNR